MGTTVGGGGGGGIWHTAHFGGGGGGGEALPSAFDGNNRAITLKRSVRARAMRIMAFDHSDSRPSPARLTGLLARPYAPDE